MQEVQPDSILTKNLEASTTLTYIHKRPAPFSLTIFTFTWPRPTSMAPQFSIKGMCTCSPSQSLQRIDRAACKPGQSSIFSGKTGFCGVSARPGSGFWIVPCVVARQRGVLKWSSLGMYLVLASSQFRWYGLSWLIQTGSVTASTTTPDVRGNPNK